MPLLCKMAFCNSYEVPLWAAWACPVVRFLGLARNSAIANERRMSDARAGFFLGMDYDWEGGAREEIW